MILNNPIISSTGTQTVRLSDVGNAQLGPEMKKPYSREQYTNDQLALVPQLRSNYIEIVDEFLWRFWATQRESLPERSYVEHHSGQYQICPVFCFNPEETLFIGFPACCHYHLLIFPGMVGTGSIGLIFLFLWLELSLSCTSWFSINILTLLAIVLATGTCSGWWNCCRNPIYKQKLWSRYENHQMLHVKGSNEIFLHFCLSSLTLAVVFFRLFSC